MLGGWLSRRLQRWLGLEADRARLTELERHLVQLADGHDRFARDATAHLAALQREWERLSSALPHGADGLGALQSCLARVSASQQTLLAQREALRAAIRTVEEAVADLEKAHTAMALKLGTGRAPRDAPE